jgi:hypothetical protein
MKEIELELQQLKKLYEIQAQKLEALERRVSALEVYVTPGTTQSNQASSPIQPEPNSIVMQEVPGSQALSHLSSLGISW